MTLRMKLATQSGKSLVVSWEMVSFKYPWRDNKADVYLQDSVLLVLAKHWPSVTHTHFIKGQSREASTTIIRLWGVIVARCRFIVVYCQVTNLDVLCDL
jgi:hypothetical protein